MKGESHCTRAPSLPVALTVVLLAAAAARAGEAGPAETGVGPAAAIRRTAVPIDLAEALARGRVDAFSAAAAEARRRGGEARLRRARGFRLPTLSLQEIWIRTDSPADAFGLTLNQERFSFADFVAGDPNDPDAVESATTRLEVALPLYTGGEISSRIRQAELGAEAGAGMAEWAGHQAALAAGEAWLDLALARERTALLERSLATVTSHVELARKSVEQGLIVTSEQLRAEVERARVADLLATARGYARVAEAQLTLRLAADPGSSWDVGPLPAAPEPRRDLEGWLAAAQGRADLEAARRGTEAAELEAEARGAARKPRLALVGRYDLVDDTPFGDHGDSTSILAMAGIDLFSGGRHAAATAQAQLEAEAAHHELEGFERSVGLEVEQAWVEADTARQRRDTAGAAVEAAREAERVVEARFRQGVVRTIDVLDAATALREAETRELEARIDAWRAALRLATRAGRPPEEALPGRDDLPERSPDHAD
ncbi:MAG: TolC family protein [Thermoanaerobaculia bacterium]